MKVHHQTLLCSQCLEVLFGYFQNVQEEWLVLICQLNANGLQNCMISV